jgi:peptide/nickel transport system ATP-binding protein
MSRPASNGNGSILEVAGLTVAYRRGDEWLAAVRNVSLALPAGQVCGLVGESGSGKTTLALAVMRYLPSEGQVRAGSIHFGGRNLLDLGPREMRSIWGKEMALVPQDPLSSLNPSLKLGRQLADLLRYRAGYGQGAARRRVLELFDSVHLDDPERVAGSYPHQVSGGMLQRVLIAMALSTEPQLLVLDEPTTGLDVTTEGAILELLRGLIRGRQTAVLYITHNLGVVAQISDRVVVLYAGEVFEDAPAEDLFRRALHPYTQGLLDSVPRLGQNKDQVQLRPIQGRIPELDRLPQGCNFRPRCPLAIEICREHPPLYDSGRRRLARCHRWDEIERQEVSARQPAGAPATATAKGNGEPVLQGQGLSVHFARRRSVADLLAGRQQPGVKAVDGVDLSIAEGTTLGLVGESGSGKTTLARAIAGLVERSGGSLQFRQMPLPSGLRGRGDEVLCCLQIVFQNPEEALNPYLSVGEALRRPVMRLLGVSRTEAGERVAALLQMVGLPPEMAHRLPGQLSGGQKQRVAIARAFATNPGLLIADEPVTSLDVSVQASILNLLVELQAQQGNATLFISHDLAVVGYVADQVAVMYRGRFMEAGPVQAVFRPPYHPYTELLLSSVPVIVAEKEEMPQSGPAARPESQGEPVGCPFHARCPRFLGRICVEQAPPWRVDEVTGKGVLCHIPLDELRQSQVPPATLRTSPAAAPPAGEEEGMP